MLLNHIVAVINRMVKIKNHVENVAHNTCHKLITIPWYPENNIKVEIRI